MRVLFAALAAVAIMSAQTPPSGGVKAGAKSEAAPAKSSKVAPAQPDWQKATELPALETAGLTAAQKSSLLKILREENCVCGCSMKLAECRIKDPACRDSRMLASIAAQEFRAGKSEASVRASVKNSELAKARRAALLGEPVRIDIQGAPSRGPANAKLTIVEFSDFQCPYCRIAAQHVYTILAKYPHDIRLVFKQYPLESHSMAAVAAEAALAAHAQGKFWELHDKMFANPKAINPNTLKAWAGEVGIDVGRFTADMTSGKYRKQVDKEADEGTAAGVTGTPSFFFNGKLYRGSMEPEAVLPVIEEELKKSSR